MGSLTNIVISFFELVEAEGRVAKRNIMLLTRSFLYLYFGMLFIFVGAMVGFTLLYMWLKTLRGIYVAGWTITLILLSIGFIMICKGKLWTKKVPSTKAKVKKNDGDTIQKQ